MIKHLAWCVVSDTYNTSFYQSSTKIIEQLKDAQKRDFLLKHYAMKWKGGFQLHRWSDTMHFTLLLSEQGVAVHGACRCTNLARTLHTWLNRPTAGKFSFSCKLECKPAESVLSYKPQMFSLCCALISKSLQEIHRSLVRALQEKLSQPLLLLQLLFYLE